MFRAIFIKSLCKGEGVRNLSEVTMDGQVEGGERNARENREGNRDM
jgi:hypothetical protein